MQDTLRRASRAGDGDKRKCFSGNETGGEPAHGIGCLRNKDGSLNLQHIADSIRESPLRMFKAKTADFRAAEKGSYGEISLLDSIYTIIFSGKYTLILPKIRTEGTAEIDGQLLKTVIDAYIRESTYKCYLIDMSAISTEEVTRLSEHFKITPNTEAHALILTAKEEK